MGNFDYQKLPSGYPDQSIQQGLKKGRGFQANWHDVIYKKVRSFIEPNNSHTSTKAYWKNCALVAICFLPD